jgi:peptidoglycan/LPS O-acetylase OafA/YrhL
VLRAVAILLVLGRHMEPCSSDQAYPVSLVMGLWGRCGWIGVDLFFVLSGFLVSGLLFREYKRYGEIDYCRFFVRRGLKIYPAFYLFLAVIFLVSLVTRNSVSLPSLFAASFFVQNYVGTLPGIWSHTWSLAIEEHFYLFIGLLFLLLLRSRLQNPFRGMIVCFVVVALGTLVWRLVNACLYPYTPLTHLFRTHLRMDSLFFGVVLAYLFNLEPGKLRLIYKHRFVVAFLSLLLIVPSCLLRVEHFFMHTIGLSFLYVGFGGILLCSLSFAEPAGVVAQRVLGSLAFLGSHSYSIYLWHLPLGIWIMPLIRSWLGGSLPYLVGVGTYCGLSIGFGIVMAKLIEMPVLRLRDKLYPSRSNPLPA